MLKISSLNDDAKPRERQPNYLNCQRHHAFLNKLINASKSYSPFGYYLYLVSTCIAMPFFSLFSNVYEIRN